MPLSSPAAEYATPSPATLPWDASMYEAAILMDNLHVRHIPVTRERAVAGILTIESVLREALRLGGLPASVRVGEAELQPAVWVEPEAPVARVAAIMVNRRVDSVLVDVEGTLSILTARDVVRASIGEFRGVPAFHLARQLPVAGMEAPVGSVVGEMLSKGYRHVVVLDDEGFIVGILSARDALAVLVRGVSLDAPTSQVMTSHVYTVDPGASADEAVEYMADRDVGMLPIVHEGRVYGAVTERSVLEAAAGRA